jgi:hypothetical protein
MTSYFLTLSGGASAADPVVTARALTGAVVADEATPVGEAGLFTDLVPLDDPDVVEVWRDRLGATPWAQLWFGLNEKRMSDESADSGMFNVVIGAMWLASRAGASAILTWEHDRIVWRRQGGRFVLHDWFPLWQQPNLPVPGSWQLTADEGRL